MGDYATIRFEVLDENTRQWEHDPSFDMDSVQNYTVFRYLFNIRNSLNFNNLNNGVYVEPIKHYRGVDVQSGYGYHEERTYYFVQAEDMIRNNERAILEIATDREPTDVRCEPLYCIILDHFRKLQMKHATRDVRLVAYIT